jgi:ribosomal protein S12 methylthiotransferase
VAATASVTFVTCGCPKNEVDTSRMRAAIEAASYEVVETPEQADVVVVNTCAFIREATEESIEVVLEAAAALRDTSGRLVVVGCLPSRYGDELADSMPEVDAFLPVREEASLVEVVHRLTGVEPRTPTDPPRATSPPSAYLTISDGCDSACAYCAIPAIRGPYRSRPRGDVLAEARSLAAAGAREVVLVGQDTTSYGSDTGDADLPALVTALARLDGLAWIRTMYAQPEGVTDRLLEVMAAEDAVCSYLDMPVQHASSRVLRAMRRAGDSESFLALLARVRAALPDVALRTTLIAGFPGETEGDVLELEEFVRRARFDYVGVFVYSPEEGTHAAALDGQLPEAIRLERAQHIRDVVDQIAYEKAEDLVGSEVEVLVEGLDEGVALGRWRGQAPEIDGVVYLDRLEEAGRLVRAKVTEALGYDLMGSVVSW